MKLVRFFFIVISFLSLSIYSAYQIPSDLMDDVLIREIYYEAEPSSNETRFELAMTYAYTGQIKTGWDMLKTVDKSYATTVVDKYNDRIQQDDVTWKDYFKLGFGYYFQKEKKQAVDSFQIAYDMYPENVWSLGFKSLVLGDMNQINEAIAVAKTALRQNDDATGIQFLLAEGYRKKGDYLKFLSRMMIVGKLQASDSHYKKKHEDEWARRKEELRKSIEENEPISVL